ncbi:scaffoldin [Neocallimastix californiae]|uniref:Scaffoldin n=1 Tax=Neocallimastix californiae TaxID=1754190 RepID=A0A1Y2BKJ5_9FUNG|nr:scaffoldin [Neocallimastix californiae]|eukprot:ORY35296.1 scaffoldin [Neocallimastix californiae]
MVNLKYIGLPLLVGLCIRRIKGACTFTYDDIITNIKANTCTADNDGYHYVVKSDDPTKYRMIKYTYDANATPKDKIEDTGAGFYVTKDKKYYTCTSATACTEKTDLNFPSVGYYKVDSYIVACKSLDNVGTSVACEEITKPTNNCSHETVGELVSISGGKYGLCLAEYEVGETPKYPTLDFLDSGVDAEEYLVKHMPKGEDSENDNRVFNFDITMNYYIVEHSVNSITLKKPSTAYVDKCALAESSKIIDRKTDFCSDGAGRYFNCLANSGKCISSLQSTPDVQELNNESCVSFTDENDSSKIKYKGNCKITSSSIEYYLIDSSSEAIIKDTSSGKIIQIKTSGEYFEKNADAIDTKGYYLNADVSKKQEYPMILCDGSNSGCKFVSKEEIIPGYYITNPKSSGTATAIKCTSSNICSVDTGGSNNGNINISGIDVKLYIDGSNDHSFDITNGVDKEYILLNVEAEAFPGVTVAGNYAVKMNVNKLETDETVAVGTILLSEKKSKCEDAEDNETVKKEDGKFYYCAGGIELPMVQSGGAIFGIFDSTDNEYKILQIGETGVTKLPKTDADIATYEGYYINRSNGGTGLIFCYKSTEDSQGETVPAYLKCENKSPTMKDKYEVFINKESGFPVSSGSSATLDAKIIICSSEKCSVPEKSDSKYKYEGKELDASHYFINHENEKVDSLIKCSSIGGDTDTCNLVKGDSLKVNFYINGIEDLSLIKCSKTKDDEDNEVISCETVGDVVKYGYYNSHDESKYIYCNNERCTEQAPDVEKSFINSDGTSKKFIISCAEDSGIKCKEVEAKDYYLDSSLTEGWNLLKCDENGCTKVEGVNRGVYISDNGKKLISCGVTGTDKKHACSVVKVDSPTGENQKYYLNGDSDAGNPIITSIKDEEPAAAKKKRADKFKWASMTEKPKADDIFINGNADTNKYKYGLILCSENDCTEIEDTNGKSYISINNGEIIKCTTKCDKDSSFLRAGEASGTTNNFVIDKSTAQIMTTGSGALVICTSDGSKWTCESKSGGNTYYTNSFDTVKLLVATDSTYTIKSAEDMGENGYFINNDDDVYQCDGSTCLALSSYEENCASDKNGLMTKSGEVCLEHTNDSDKKASRNSNKLYIFKSNGFPGTTNGDLIMIYASEKKIVEVKPTSDAYYLIGEDLYPVTSDELGTVYKYTASSKSLQKLNPQVTTYYPNSDESTVKKYQNIKFECKLSQRSGDDVYCLKTGSNGKVALNSCEKNCDGTCYEITHKAGYYLPYEKSFLIDCSSGCRVNNNLSEGYYKSEDAANTLIRCNKSAEGYRCEYEPIINNGYYIGASKNLIKCTDGTCEEVNDATKGRYVSAESGKALTYCTGQNKNLICTSDSKPAIGYYLNGDKKVNPLIICTSDSSGKVTCSDIAIPNKGYFINSAYKSTTDADDDKYLIDCSDGKLCKLATPYAKGYYVNGVNKQLIYCKSVDDCSEYEGKGWYLEGNVDTPPIYCDGTCSNKSIDELKKGFYINGDTNTNKIYPLYENNNGKFETYPKGNDDKFTGWYINAGSTSSNDKILECVDGIIRNCTPKAVATDCVNGKFFENGGVIKWCINNNEVNLLAAGESTRYVYANISSKNLFSWISDTTGYLKFEISENYVKQNKINGYSYDKDNDQLYYCNGFGSGVCNLLKSSEITPGYYINYSDNAIIICGKDKDSLCTNVNKESLKGSDAKNKYDVIIGNDNKKSTFDNLYLCSASTDQDPVIMSKVTSETLYALPNYKTKEFPKPKGESYARYILVDVNKYYVKFRENIEEVPKCTNDESNDDIDENKVCLNDGKLYYVKTQKAVGYSSTANIPVNTSYIKKEIEYDADTNSGYFEYTGDETNNILNKVYIKKIDNTRTEFKYECPIKGVCIRREKAKEPILGYQLENGIPVEKVRGENSKEVSKKFMPGIYIKHDGIKRDTKEVISCSYNSFFNVICEIINKSSSGISVTEKGITVGNIQSSKLFTKLVGTKVRRNSKRGLLEKRESEEVLILKELSSASYNEATFSESTNIFLTADLKKITNEVLTKTEEEKVTGYTCNQEGECIEIKKDGNKKYLLNSAQAGNSKNAVVVCGSIESKGRCRFIDATNGSVYENYAATSSADAIITCTSDGCRTAAVENIGSLPNCKKNALNVVEKEASSGSCIRADNSKPLLDGQHCIFEGVIYEYKEYEEVGIDNCKAISDIGIKLFDATYREISISRVAENHYGAVLYNCPTASGGCYVTYGYIAGTTTTTTSYSICNRDGCIYKSDLTELKENCAEAGEGSLIYTSKTIKLCKTNGSVNTAGYYPVAISSNDNFPTAIFGDNILVDIEISLNIATYTLVLNDGYILLDNKNKILNSNTSPSPSKVDMEGTSSASIYNCKSADRLCKKIDNPEYGYYRSSSFSTDLITVKLESNNKIASITPIESITIKFTENNEENKYYSVPVSTGFPGYTYGVIAEASKYSIIPIKVDNYVLLNTYENRLATKNEARDMKNLFLCNSSVGKCVSSEIEDGWYVSGQNGYEAIVCEKGSCSMKETINRSCSGEGDFIITDNTYNICILKDKSISKFKLSENAGKVSELTSNRIVFPNSKSYIVVNINSVKGIGYRDAESGTTPSGITVCKSFSSTTGVCIKSDGKVLENDEYCLFGTKIYANTTESGISSCSQKFTTGVNVEMFYGSRWVKSITISDPSTFYGAQLFYCSNGECRLTTGYKKLNKIFKCNFGVCEQATNTGTENGDLVSQKLKIGDTNKSFEKDKYYYISGSNNFPGAENYKSFIIEMSDTYAVPFVGNGYYLISSSNAILSKDPKDTDFTTEKNNKLYYCNNIDKNCEIIDNSSGKLAENAFYKNAASSDPSKRAIIGCYNSICVIAQDGIIFDENETSCKYAGMLIRTTSEPDDKGERTYGEYKFCKSRQSAPVTSDVNNSKYYMVQIARNDTFASVALKNEIEYETVKRNIIVEVGNGYISQYEKEGYILFNPTTNEIVETVGSNRGTLYSCKRSKNYEGASNYSYACDLVNNINNGWYFNKIYGDKRVIRCIDGACTIIEVNESDKCNSKGSLIYNKGFKICQTLNKQIDVSNISESYNIVMEVSLLNEFPGMKTNNTEILLSVNKDSIYQIKMKTNVVVNDGNTLISNAEGNLYECYSDGHCDINKIPKDNYYLKSDSDGKDVELIKCNERKCKVISNEEGDGKGNKEGFRVSANTRAPLIQCVKPGTLNNDGTFVASGIAECKEKEFKEGWFINSGSDSNNYPLIECTKEFGCITKASEGDGWYLNAGASTTYSKIGGYYYPIIKCENGNCNYITEEFEKECKKGGTMVMPSNGNYKLCKEEGKFIEFSRTSTIEIINNEGSKTAVETFSNKIVNAGNGFYYKGNVMYECSGTCTELNGDDKNGIYVYDKISSILMIATCSEGNCSWSNIKNEGNYFIDDKKYLVTNKATGVSEIYECIKNSVTKNIVCEEVLENNSRGYFFNSEIIDQDGKQEELLYLCEGNSCEVEENVPKCTELTYKKNYCYISYVDEENTEEYNGKEPIIEGGSMCIDKNTYYFAISEINTGIDKSNCVPKTSDQNNNYYQVTNGSGVTTIYLQNKYNTRRVSINNSVINGINKNSVIITTNKNSNNALLLEDNYNYVSCINQKCELNKLTTCSYNFQTEKCSVSSGSVNPGQLCISSEKQLYFALERLTSSGGKCVNHNTGWSYSLGSNTVEPDYSIVDASKEKYDDIWFVVEGKMYKIESNNDIYLQKEGVYLIDSANKKVDIGKNVDISKESQFKLYICNSAGCKVKNSCNNGINYEYIYDSINGKVIQCDPKSNTINYIEGNGYYLNSAWEDVVKCTKGVCIEYNTDIGMEGYYYDAGNTEKIIKCTRNGTTFKCINEDIISCTYVAKSNRCSSSVDLKRNSYCVYVNKVKGKIIGNPVMLYVPDFIKANDEGKCIENEGTDEYYYHYRKSKFLGNDERDEIIKYSKGAIVSLYEKDIGYYIITTNTRKGITANTNLNQSRMYECTQNGCTEQRNPENDRIYINKASIEKLVRYHSNGKYWEVMKRHCVKSTINVGQCELPNSGIKEGDIIYLFENGDINPEFLASKVSLTIRSTLIEENNDKIENTKYQYFNTDKLMYLLNSNNQSFDPVKESGNYMFEKSSNYHNLIPYRSTVNTTDTTRIQIYSYGGSWNVKNEFKFENFDEGYYWNKADLNGEGIVIQVMNVPTKKEVEEENTLIKREEDEKEIKISKREDEESVYKFKAVLNKCVSIKKGVCTSAQDGKNLGKGDVCVVVDGEFRGLYLAIDNIAKNSNNNNCIRYDNGNGYLYVAGKNEFSGEPLRKSVSNAIEFAGQPLVKTIIKVKEDSINAFTEKNTFGYYVIEKNEKKQLSSTTTVDATGYYCGWEYDLILEGENVGKENPETKRFECNPVKASNKYFYTISGDIVYAKSDSKWNVETKRGYYFFNKEFVAATVTQDENGKNVADAILYNSSNVNRPGTYINSATTTPVVVENSSANKKSIVTDYKTCQVTGETCKSTVANVELSNGEVCYASNKSNSLFLVVVTEEENAGKKYNCYTGSEKIKYRYVNNMLYKLDGFSVQEVVKGYYILNKNWEEFSTTYPEVPPYVFNCDGSKCEVVKEKIDINSDVIVNAAGTGNNKLLRYYPSSLKFVNVFKPGYYLVNSNSEVTKISGNNDYVNKYYLDESGNLTQLPATFEFNNIYINNAKEGSLTRYYSEFESSKITLNTRTGYLEYEGTSNVGNEIKYVFIDRLYVQKQYHFEEVTNGLYAIKNNLAFENTEWTSLSSGSEICYYVNGSCDLNKLNTIKKQKYTINYSTRKPTVIEYSSTSGDWRIVDEDGIYFFFEDGYSITATDRRIDRVFEVLEGESIEITNDKNRLGYYRFNNLTIESNENRWEDAQVTIGTVVESKRVCQSYETDEIIDTNKLCHNEVLGVCIPKLNIENNSEENNCIFSDGRSIYYFLVGEKLYSVNDQSFRNIKKPGLYIVNNQKKIFEEKLETKAIVYSCDENSCKNENELSSGYYLNMANGGIDEPAILYYNKSRKTWRKTTDTGIYLFNSKGYAVGDGEDVAFAYVVKENGNEVYSVLENNENGVFINQCSEDENIIVEFSNQWEKAKKVPSCKISNGKVTSSEVMKVGDICIDNKKMVVITMDNGNKKRDDEYTYEGITAEGDEEKYGFNSSDQQIVKLVEGNMVKLNINGYAIIDKATHMALDSIEPSEADVYKCVNGKCSEVDVSSFKDKSNVINALSEDNPLVRFEDGKWAVETEEGYYFFKLDWNAVGNDDVVYGAVEVELDSNENPIQRDITNSNELGFYLNKASTESIIVNNDIEFWGKGSTLHKCNVTISEEGNICRTMKETKVETLSEGDYCYDGEKVFLLTAEASSEVSEINCISGSNEEPLYVTPDKVSNINEKDVGTKLIRLTDQSIKVVSPGIYIINENGTLIDNNGEEGEIEMHIYICDEEECSEESSMGENIKFLTEAGDIFEIDEKGRLEKVESEGLYFFKENGVACTAEGDIVESIIRLSIVDTKLVKEEVELDELSIGYYVNSANQKTVGEYDGEKWTISEIDCKYDEETNGCTSESSNLEIGEFCIIDGSIYVVNEFEEEKEIYKCIPGSDQTPLYLMKEDSKLMIIKEKSVGIVDDDGYYAINANSGEGLKSDSATVAKFFKCEAGYECNEVKPEKSSSYLNKAVENSNIVKFNEKGSLKEAVTLENRCTVNNNSCTAEEGELAAGDICVNDNSLYLVKEDSQCVMAESNIETYQYVNNKIYRLVADTVVQKFDGYYFIDGNNRAITNVEDYGKPDTVGYMCSVKGECYEIAPIAERYFKDYTTIRDNKFKVIKYDPSKKSKREESSGYEIITKDGIYKLDDGSYCECETENNDEVSCKNIDEVGTKVTVDNEIVLCSKENKTIECVQATEGGYYLIGEVLMECSANEEGDQLKCEEVMKEGYFLADGKDVLYECVEKVEEVNVSQIDSELYEDIEMEEENENAEDDLTEENEVELKKRQESVPTVTEKEQTVTEGATETPTEVPEEPKGPIDVTCKVIECVEGTVVKSGGENSVDLYICKVVENTEEKPTETSKEETDEEDDGEEDEDEEITKYQWVSKDCESGNFLKKNDSYYECEDKKENIKEEYIEKPNEEHVVTEPKTPVTRTKTTTTTTTAAEEVTTTSTAETTTSSSEGKTTTTKKSSITTSTKSKPSDMTTTTTSKTTTSKTTVATTTTGSGASLRSMPSYTLFIVLFIFMIFLQY